MSQITQGWDVGEQQKFFSRLGNWFRKGQADPSADPAAEVEDGETALLDVGTPGGDEPEGNGNNIEPRNTFLRPWAKRDQALDNLNRGIGALGDLLTTLRDNMDRQSQRHEDLLGQLASLPEALRAIPEAGRIQGEALKAIHQQIERQSNQQSKLGDVLERISQSDSRQSGALDSLHQAVSGLNDHDQAISSNLQSLGVALESMTTNSQSSARVLEQMRDSTARHDGDLETIIKRQSRRFTTLLTIAIVLSVGALAAVSVSGYFVFETLTRFKP